MKYKWQSFFVDRVKSTPFIPVTRKMEYCVTLEAHTSLEKYIDFYCLKGAGRFWAVISMVMQPKVIVEFGTANGATTNLLAKLNPQAIVHSLDHIGNAGSAGAPSGFLAKDAENVNLIIGDSKLFECKDVDVCYIDGNHSRESVIVDSERAWENKNFEGDWCIIWDDEDLASVKEGLSDVTSRLQLEMQAAWNRPFVGTRNVEEFHNLGKERN